MLIIAHRVRYELSMTKPTQKQETQASKTNDGCLVIVMSEHPSYVATILDSFDFLLHIINVLAHAPTTIQLLRVHNQGGYEERNNNNCRNFILSRFECLNVGIAKYTTCNENNQLYNF